MYNFFVQSGNTHTNIGLNNCKLVSHSHRFGFGQDHSSSNQSLEVNYKIKNSLPCLFVF